VSCTRAGLGVAAPGRGGRARCRGAGRVPPRLLAPATSFSSTGCRSSSLGVLRPECSWPSSSSDLRFGARPRALDVPHVQHLVLMTVAAPLILLGHPSLALRSGVPRPIAAAIETVLRSGTMRSLRAPAAASDLVVAGGYRGRPRMARSGAAQRAMSHALLAPDTAGQLSRRRCLFWRPVLARGRMDLYVRCICCSRRSRATRCLPSSAFCGRVVYACHRGKRRLLWPLAASGPAVRWRTDVVLGAVAYWFRGSRHLRLLSPRPRGRSR